jgi:hypothetical protein
MWSLDFLKLPDDGAARFILKNFRMRNVDQPKRRLEPHELAPEPIFSLSV